MNGLRNATLSRRYCTSCACCTYVWNLNEKRRSVSTRRRRKEFEAEESSPRLERVERQQCHQPAPALAHRAHAARQRRFDALALAP
eukprot:scaffold25779_cov36-Phaeocystis_antarctica.AAC.1